jgi:hypothetical protein
VFDLMRYNATPYQDLLREADNERLIALLPPRYGAARRGTASLCRRLAHWLDDSKRYRRPAEAGPADWATHSVRM